MSDYEKYPPNVGLFVALLACVLFWTALVVVLGWLLATIFALVAFAAVLFIVFFDEKGDGS